MFICLICSALSLIMSICVVFPFSYVVLRNSSLLSGTKYRTILDHIRNAPVCSHAAAICFLIYLRFCSNVALGLSALYDLVIFKVYIIASTNRKNN